MLWSMNARFKRALLIALLALTVLWVIWSARGGLYPYLIALLIGYLVHPVVNFLDEHMPVVLQRRRMSRPLAILIVYLLIIGMAVTIIAFLVPLIWGQLQELLAAFPALLEGARSRMDWGLTDWYLNAWDYVSRLAEQYFGVRLEDVAQGNLRPQVEQWLLEWIQRAVNLVISGVQQGITRSLSVITSTVSFVLGILILPFWLFYVLNDHARVLTGVMRLVPERYRLDAHFLLRTADGVLSAYVRGQLLLCFFIFVIDSIGLAIIGVNFPLLLGLIAGVLEIFPFIGPILGAIPALLVALLQSPTKALWALILFVGVQQVENIFLVPRIQGQNVQLHPALIMLVLVIGNELAGIWGMLLAVPLTAILRDVFKYVYLRLSDEMLDPPAAFARIRHSAFTLDI
ncbi:MAG: AI-2E family transporter [Anaerolineae bacterium]|nr:AI-2E family transporter [Anaerolineae bacterium]MDW8099266.1 AI-2E family transporter [Anaerolineae bacterium]